MKTTRFAVFSVLASFLLLAGCERNAHLDLPAQEGKLSNLQEEIATSTSAQSAAGTCNPNAYIVTLESKTLVGSNWEWIWSVQNSNPGNGTNGTVQDLSHWGMQFGTCFIWPHVVAAAYSFNNTSWTSFTPSYSVDPSQGCVTTPVLKFDVGTSGTARTYYRLTLNHDYPTGPSFGYYKSGQRTGCCTFSFNGVGCPADDGSDR
jgi:outer membrane murein-binding lipoprotein Lpp